MLTPIKQSHSSVHNVYRNLPPKIQQSIKLKDEVGRSTRHAHTDKSLQKKLNQSNQK